MISKKRAKNIRAAQDQFIALTLEGKQNQRQICEAVGISQKTACAWKHSEEFIERLEERRKAKEAAYSDTKARLEDELLSNAIECIRQATQDPEQGKVALEVLAALLPETWDAAIRRKIWEKKNMEEGSGAPPAVTLTRSVEPLRLVKSDDKKVAEE